MKIKNEVIKFLGLGNVYTMYKEELTNVKVVGYTFYFDENGAYVEYYVTLPDGSTVIMDDSYKFYRSQEEFERGNEVSKIEQYVCTAIGSYAHSTNISCEDVSECVDGVECKVAIPYCWVFENGEPVRVDLTIEKIVVNKGVTVIGTDIPEKRYLTRTQAIEWNDYIVQEADGSKRKQIALIPRIVLTDEQKEAVKAVKDAYEKARELGVRFIWDSENERQRVINITNLKLFENEDTYTHDRKSDEETKNQIPLESRLYIDELSSGIEIYDFWINCDLDIYVELKDE